jgi:hypothetical protein
MSEKCWVMGRETKISPSKSLIQGEREMLTARVKPLS